MTIARTARFHEAGGPEVLRIDEIDVPLPPAGQVRIQIKAIGLNRAELLYRAGGYSERPLFPSRIGYEAAGLIDAVGEGVDDLVVGDAVSLVPIFSQNRWGAA